MRENRRFLNADYISGSNNAESNSVLFFCTTLIAITLFFVFLVGYGFSEKAYASTVVSGSEKGVMTFQIVKDKEEPKIVTPEKEKESESIIPVSYDTDKAEKLTFTGDNPYILLLTIVGAGLNGFACLMLVRKLACEKDVRADIRTEATVAGALFVIACLVISSVMAIKANAEEDVKHLDSKAIVKIKEDGTVISSNMQTTNNFDGKIMLTSIKMPECLKDCKCDVNNHKLGKGDGCKCKCELGGKVNNKILTEAKDNDGSITYEYDVNFQFTKFNFSWDVNGGHFTDKAIAREDVMEDCIAHFLEKKPVRAHYTFKEWNLKSDGSGEVVDKAWITKHNADKDIKFFAIWTPEKYSINYELNGGELDESNENEYTYGKGISKFNAPHKQGYVFDGWYTALTGGEKVERIATTDFGNKKLFARWVGAKDTKYVVKHFFENVENDQFTLDDNATQVLTGETDTLTSAKAISRTGFTPLDFSQEKIAADGKTELIVKYKRNLHTITFDTQGKGETPEAIRGIKFGKKVTFSIDIACENYDFGGWYLEPDCKSKWENEQTMGDSDVVLYAKWTGKPYKIVFHKNNDAATGSMTEQNLNYGESKKLSKSNFSYDNHVFAGWMLDSTNTKADFKDEESVDIFNKSFNGIVNLYALWHTSSEFWMGKANVSIPEPAVVDGVSGTKTVLEVERDIQKLKSGDKSTIDEYTKIMNEDKMHFFTKIGNGNSADDFLEMRIVQVGQHDGDGSVLTLQAVHMLPKAYAHLNTDTNEGGWGVSLIRSEMNNNGGKIRALFNSRLFTHVKTLNKLYGQGSGKVDPFASLTNFWIMSRSELTGAGLTNEKGTLMEGSQYAFWKNKGVSLSSYGALAMKTRSGRVPEGASFGDGCWNTRTPSHTWSGSFMNVAADGNPDDSSLSTRLMGVVPCFSF